MTDYRRSYLKSTAFAFAAAVASTLTAAALWWGLPAWRMLAWLPVLALLALATLMTAVGFGGLLALGADRREREASPDGGLREAGIDGI